MYLQVLRSHQTKRSRLSPSPPICITLGFEWHSTECHSAKLNFFLPPNLSLCLKGIFALWYNLSSFCWFASTDVCDSKPLIPTRIRHWQKCHQNCWRMKKTCWSAHCSEAFTHLFKQSSLIGYIDTWRKNGRQRFPSLTVNSRSVHRPVSVRDRAR